MAVNEDLTDYEVKFFGTIAVLQRAPVHIVTGSAGCREGRDPFKHKPAGWSAFRAQDFGYSRLKAYNQTHVHVEQVSAERGGQVIDEFWLVKDKRSSSTKRL